MLHPQERPRIKAVIITLDRKLFVGTHIPDIVVAKHLDQTSSYKEPISVYVLITDY